ncbi:EamA family transporter RarD [Seohaeicola saemankumensis]|uniref:EamA family transporter RarD n=1 Tax=Seohaeicola saemankumensis TaxID=481181 RepID=UPI001E29A829|nr:EamA family transporter RarD [Seohaeicola saemankumensis]MCD1624408.1 EamA family transporter RarD [Seohaeicola saemankumensis]
MTEAGKGVAALVAACTVWGLSGLYYKLLAHIPPIEILAHRTLWSLVFFTLVLLAQGRLGQLRLALGSRRAAAMIGFAALMISVNWFVFILSIQIGKATEASLGYYLFPLVAVGIGRVIFGERLSRMQGVAVALAACAVILLTIGLGVAPWIAVILSLSFGLYSLVKKRLSTGPMVSVTAEVLLLAPVALGVLGVAHHNGGGAFGADLADSLLLMFAGILTAGPLMLFSYASKRVRMGTVGLVQYINPTLQFVVAVAVFAEPFTGWQVASFVLIWIALALYSASSVSLERVARRARASSSTVSTTVMKPASDGSAKP